MTFRSRLCGLEINSKDLPTIYSRIVNTSKDSPQITALSLVMDELERATARYAPMNSAHEGYAVILEELDELKAEVWKSPKNRDAQAMLSETVQVAAMALRFIVDVALPETDAERSINRESEVSD